MKRQTFSDVEYSGHKRKTKREEFLDITFMHCSRLHYIFASSATLLQAVGGVDGYPRADVLCCAVLSAERKK